MIEFLTGADLPPYLTMWMMSYGKWIMVGVKEMSRCTDVLPVLLPGRGPQQCGAAIGSRRPGFLTQLSHWLTVWPDPALRASVFSSRKWLSSKSPSLWSLPVLPTILWLKDSASPCLIMASENHRFAAGKDSRAPSFSGKALLFSPTPLISWMKELRPREVKKAHWGRVGVVNR